MSKSTPVPVPLNKLRNLSFEVREAAHAVVLRAWKIKAVRDFYEAREEEIRDLEFDLLVTHLKCPLDFERLKTTDEFNLAHDVLGITRHLDRETGELRHCFLPRLHK